MSAGGTSYLSTPGFIVRSTEQEAALAVLDGLDMKGRKRKVTVVPRTETLRLPCVSHSVPVQSRPAAVLRLLPDVSQCSQNRPGTGEVEAAVSGIKGPALATTETSRPT